MSNIQSPVAKTDGRIKRIQRGISGGGITINLTIHAIRINDHRTLSQFSEGTRIECEATLPDGTKVPVVFKADMRGGGMGSFGLQVEGDKALMPLLFEIESGSKATAAPMFA